MARRTIHVALLAEGTAVWRPVEAEELRDGLFRIISENSDPENERWEFAPGSVVRCERRHLSEGPALLPFRKRPSNKPLQPTSGGHGWRESGSMVRAARG